MSNNYKSYPKDIRELLYCNFINIDDVEQRHIDEYLRKIGRV